MNLRPPGYEPDELPTALSRDISDIIIILLEVKMVEGTGFEPVKAKPTDLQSAPFGQLGNPSMYKAVILKYWSRRWDSNPQPADYKSAALPIELRRRGLSS